MPPPQTLGIACLSNGLAACRQDHVLPPHLGSYGSLGGRQNLSGMWLRPTPFMEDIFCLIHHALVCLIIEYLYQNAFTEFLSRANSVSGTWMFCYILRCLGTTFPAELWWKRRTCNGPVYQAATSSHSKAACVEQMWSVLLIVTCAAGRSIKSSATILRVRVGGTTFNSSHQSSN